MRRTGGRGGGGFGSATQQIHGGVQTKAEKKKGNRRKKKRNNAKGGKGHWAASKRWRCWWWWWRLARRRTGKNSIRLVSIWIPILVSAAVDALAAEGACLIKNSDAVVILPWGSKQGALPRLSLALHNPGLKSYFQLINIEAILNQVCKF